MQRTSSFLYRSDDYSNSIYNENLKLDNPTTYHGPVLDRKTTDKLWLCLYLLSLVGWISYGVYSIISNGTLESLIEISNKSADFRLSSKNENEKMPEFLLRLCYIFGCTGLNILLCMIYAFFLHNATAVIVWISIWIVMALFLAGIIYGGFFLPKSTEVIIGIVIVSIIYFVLFVIIICLRRKINKCILVLHEACKAVNDTKNTMLLSLLSNALFLILISYTSLVICCGLLRHLDAIVNRQNNESYLGGNTSGYEIKRDNSTGFMLAECLILFLHIFLFWWTSCLFNDVIYMTLAGVFSTWYWTFDKKRLPSSRLRKALQRTIRYHLGTVALGSLILTLIRLLRMLLKASKARRGRGILGIFCICLSQPVACLEKLIKAINKNAYVATAIYGHDFCYSARYVFMLLLKNYHKTVVLEKVISLVFCLAKILISTTMGGVLYYCLVMQEKIQQSPALWTGISVCVTIYYIICSAFFGVYQAATETIFICYLEDKEKNDGSEERPFYMPVLLKQALASEKDKR